MKQIFLCEAMTLYRHVFHNLLLYNCDAYLLITAPITVHDGYKYNATETPGHLYTGANNLRSINEYAH